MLIFTDYIYKAGDKCKVKNLTYVDHKWILLPSGECGSHCGVVVKVMDCSIVASEFELLSLYYVHFYLIPSEKVWTLYSPAMSFYKDDFGLNNPMKVDMPLKKESNK